MKDKKPVIGIVLDWKDDGRFSNYPYYAMEQYHFEAIGKAGGVPIAIPLEDKFIETYLDMIDGLLIPGGVFPVPDDWYVTNSNTPPAYLTRPNFEKVFIKKALDNNIPTLGICAGMQSLCVISGGTLHRNVHDVYDTSVNHSNEKPTAELCHKVNIVEDSLLHKIIGETEIDVNSHHNESVAKVGNNVIISATAPDGVIEAIELTNKKFALGVVWHPEYFLEDDSPHFKIFKSFVEACK